MIKSLGQTKFKVTVELVLSLTVIPAVPPFYIAPVQPLYEIFCPRMGGASVRLARGGYHTGAPELRQTVPTYYLGESPVSKDSK